MILISFESFLNQEWIFFKLFPEALSRIYRSASSRSHNLCYNWRSEEAYSILHHLLLQFRFTLLPLHQSFSLLNFQRIHPFLLWIEDPSEVGLISVAYVLDTLFDELRAECYAPALLFGFWPLLTNWHKCLPALHNFPAWIIKAEKDTSIKHKHQLRIFTSQI